MDDMEHLSKPSEDVSEVIFSQPEERAGATGPYHPVLDRRKEDGWLDDTEPYQGARPRTTEVHRSVDDVLSATISGTEQDLNFRDTSIPKLPPEQQIRGTDTTTKGATQGRVSATEGPRAMTNGTVLAPGGLTDQRTETAGRNRQTEEWSPVAALENTVSRLQRDLEDLPDREPVSEDAEATGVRAPGTTGRTHDDKSTLV